MLLRIHRYRNLDISNAFYAAHQIRCIAIALRMRRIAFSNATDRIATQRHNVANTGRHIRADHTIDLRAVGSHAGQMRSRCERGLRYDPPDSRVGALACRSAGAVGDGDEGGGEWRESRDRLPQGFFHLLGLRRKELEGNVHTAPLWRE